MTTDDLNENELAMTPDLSLRTINALEQHGITSLAALTTLNGLSREQLADIKGIGKVGADEVRRTLGRLMDVGYSTRSS
jgi:DNA-directed RNA polymerase alpha subunit